MSSSASPTPPAAKVICPLCKGARMVTVQSITTDAEGAQTTFSRVIGCARCYATGEIEAPLALATL